MPKVPFLGHLVGEGRTAETAFQEAKDGFELLMGASGFNAGVTVQQQVNGVWEPLAFVSKKFSPAQTHVYPVSACVDSFPRLLKAFSMSSHEAPVD